MNKLLIGLMIVVLFCGFQTDSGTEDSGIRILFTGQYHGNEIQAVSGEEWFGLFSTSDGHSLDKCVIQVEFTVDIILDTGNQKTGKFVSSLSNTQPIFFLKGDLFKRGSIKTLFSGDLSLANFDVVTINMNDSDRYYLSNVKKKVIEDGHTITKDVFLLLNINATLDTLTYFRFLDDDGPPKILWAGDLDRDGKLDLLIDIANHYNLREPTLFLSSQAKEGKLVEKVASIRKGGC